MDAAGVFGDDPRNPRVIKTYSKKGYRFIGPVEEASKESNLQNGGQREPRLAAFVSGERRPEAGFAWKRAYFVVPVGLLLAIVWLTFHYGSPPAAGAASWGEPAGISIAVLPFANLTGSPEYEYQTDGLTDELTSALVGVRGVRVVARSSAYHFKGKSEDVRSVGRQLKADTVVEGSVRRSGNGVRVIAQLSSVSDGYELWSKTYESGPKDLSAIAADLSQGIASRLNLELRAGAFRRVHVDSEAHDLYLKGRYLWNQRNQDALRKSVDDFERAIAREPGYALAYAGLADAYAV
jgi:TolB-like protein